MRIYPSNCSRTQTLKNNNHWGLVMDLLACPMCGSELFLSTRAGERIVFKMDAERRPVLMHPEHSSMGAPPINPQALFCGACSWQGSIEALVESRQ